MGSGAAGIERIEAHFRGQAFSPHRHDTYGIGITLTGVQTFRYRGEQRYCRPGQCHILHPDETHDGAPATDEGFGYRIVHIDPSLIQEALGGKPLPFVPDPVIDASALSKDFAVAVLDIDSEIDDLARIEMATTVADMLIAASSGAPRISGSLSLKPLVRVRDLIAADPAKRHSMAALERVSGLDRWTLARQFRAAFGTSPGRYRTMRQLDHVRASLRSGASIAEAAIMGGFADQSHMSRRFKAAYGLTPAHWASAITWPSRNPPAAPAPRPGIPHAG
jgi:AraC-like DNA-binding protein